MPRPECIIVIMDIIIEGASVFYRHGNFTRGTGQIWLSGVRCDTSQTRLIDCAADNFGDTGDCTHAQDAAVGCCMCICSKLSIPAMQLNTHVVPTCQQGAIRLQDGDRGRVEVCIDDVWREICNGWDIRDAQVVCRQLGFSPQSEFAVAPC